MSHDKKEAPAFSKSELTVINNALNDLLHGVGFSDDELSTRLGAKRAEVERLLAKVQAALRGSK